MHKYGIPIKKPLSKRKGEVIASTKKLYIARKIRKYLNQKNSCYAFNSVLQKIQVGHIKLFLKERKQSCLN